MVPMTLKPAFLKVFSSARDDCVSEVIGAWKAHAPSSAAWQTPSSNRMAGTADAPMRLAHEERAHHGDRLDAEIVVERVGKEADDLDRRNVERHDPDAETVMQHVGHPLPIACLVRFDAAIPVVRLLPNAPATAPPCRRRRPSWRCGNRSGPASCDRCAVSLAG